MRLRSVILAGCLLLWAAPAFSQGCAMCYGSSVAASKDGQKAVNKGVLVLLIPPMGFMTLGIWMAYRYSRKRDLEQQRSSPTASSNSTCIWKIPSEEVASRPAMALDSHGY